MKEQCISCGRDNVPLFPIESAFLPQGHKVCAKCAAKFDDLREALGQEADRIMVSHRVDPQFHCHGCGEVVLMTSLETVPMYCQCCLHRIYKDWRAC